MRNYHTNKDKVGYSLILNIGDDCILREFRYQTEISAFGFLDDNHFEDRKFDLDSNSISMDMILAEFREPEYEY